MSGGRPVASDFFPKDLTQRRKGAKKDQKFTNLLKTSAPSRLCENSSGKNPRLCENSSGKNPRLCERSFLLFTAIFLITAFCAFAQAEETTEETEETREPVVIEQIWLDEPGGKRGKIAALGLALEGWNFNSRHNFSNGAALAFDVDIPYFMAVGIAFTASHNFAGIVVLEPSTFFRWYALGMIEQKHSSLFVQADFSPYMVLEEGALIPMFSAGLRVGYRQLMDSFYVEPYARFGYPYIFGVGLAAGVKL